MNELIKELKGTVVAWESLRRISQLSEQAILAGVIGDVEAIIRRHSAEVEPLAVLANRKGWWITCIRKRPIGWCINMDSQENYPDIAEELLNTIYADTFSAAEAKARAYLEGLNDVREGE